MQTPMDVRFTTPAHPLDVGTPDQTIGLYGYGTEEGQRLVLGCTECGARREVLLGDHEVGRLALDFRQHHFSCCRDSHARLDHLWEEVLQLTVADFLGTSTDHPAGGRFVAVIPDDLGRCEDVPEWWEPCEVVPDGGRHERARCRQKLKARGTRPGFAMLVQPEIVPVGSGKLSTRRIEVILLTEQVVQRYTLPRSRAEAWAHQNWSFAHVARREVANPLARYLEGLFVHEC